MRTRKRVISVENEDSGEHLHRRSTLRKKQRTEYATRGESDARSDSESDSEGEFHSWRVTCGDKEGFLHIEKLERGQECIESHGRWFSPTAFEQFGGKGGWKKWKISIIYDNHPLQYWIDHGHITPKRVKKMPYNKTSHPEESGDGEEEEEQGETEDAQAVDQNGELGNDSLKKTEILTLNTKPMLILPNLDHLQEDFQLLLNNVVLPQKVIMAEDGLDTEEGNEPMEEKHDTPSENEDEIEDTSCAAEESKLQQPEDVTVQKTGDKEAHKGGSSAEEPDDELKELSPGVDLMLKSKEDKREEKGADTLDTEQISESLEEIGNHEHEEDPMLNVEINVPELKNRKGKEVDASSPQEINNENIMAVEFSTTKKSSNGANKMLDLPQRPLIERPSPEDNPCTIKKDQAPAQTSDELNVMDLKQLTKEKLKMQIKVLLLQEQYYTLQLQQQLQ